MDHLQPFGLSPAWPERGPLQCFSDRSAESKTLHQQSSWLLGLLQVPYLSEPNHKRRMDHLTGNWAGSNHNLVQSRASANERRWGDSIPSILPLFWTKHITSQLLSYCCPYFSSLAGRVAVVYSMILRRWVKGRRSRESCSELVRRTVWCVTQ